ncbi:radical SAM family heme chaperone HemW [Fodinibius sp.]|uniref:radical SAM family heme chaperone HemW n=1 Tax=Fodinibius sp. TaxID=1872440 RepID=UPI002ACD73C2|nr:radical SAM family heme chaperone HemW [Fodinibius sp.]MDZ7659944.1 radical SAM family heme chaperone HemW [Fodinibius sp.]
MSGIYLHIPFCKQACSYCDFYFVTRTSEREHFVQRLIEDIESYRDSKFTDETVETIYFGGGTPSLLEPAQLEQIMEALYDIFDIDAREITLEMNPDDVSGQFLADLKSLGISRASMGVQSFEPELLEFMHRAHSSEEALQCLELLSASDFDSFTVDLIYGNPGQSVEQLKSDVKKLLAFDPPHISAYSLTIEPKTRLGKQVELGRIAPPEDDKVAKHFDIINQLFSSHGIERYEVSNYSMPGKEAIHNSNYWKHENYLGLGPGAHSFWWDDSAERWENEEDLRKYLRDEDQPEREVLSLKQLAEERLMMGLRTRKGVGIAELSERYDYVLSSRQLDYLENREQEDKLEVDERITLTDEGIKIADAIILDLVTLH